MNAEKIKELEEKLREMLELSMKVQTKKSQGEKRPGSNYVIRRRKGESDKRIVLN